MKFKLISATLSLLTIAFATGNEVKINRSALGFFQPLPENADSAANPFSEEKLELGKMLYHDKRLSKDRSVSCNSCHDLSSFGDDGAPTSTGIKNQKGGRSAPTVYNAALHIAQFWDGRAPDVEAQAVGPILNPIEMGMPDPVYVLKVLKSIPGYVEAFKKAFPDEADPVTYDNVGNAIGAFERRLLTPAPWDHFLKGNDDALTVKQKKGFNLFISKGCAGCHNGVGVGGHMYQKLGLVKPWPTKDKGRAEVEGFEAMEGFFKVPSLRNITETGPYLHDGSISDLKEMVKKMADHQAGQKVTDEEADLIVSFLQSLKGEVTPEELAVVPDLPEDGPNTPAAAN
ncbi:MAG: cytochrome c peroxidase [Verrucomicrobiales bacterium]|nr:cytochrome c peroxidase [Verrucomicrobiales bacterium]